MAWRNGADAIITIDDDNFVCNQDFVGLHQVVGSERHRTCYGSTAGWFDVCSLLDVDHGMRFYHRGYPQKMRWREHEHFVTSQRACAQGGGERRLLAR